MILRLSVLTYNALSLTCDGQTDRHKDGQMDTSHVRCSITKRRKKLALLTGGAQLHTYREKTLKNPNWVGKENLRIVGYSRRS